MHRSFAFVRVSPFNRPLALAALLLSVGCVDTTGSILSLGREQQVVPEQPDPPDPDPPDPGDEPTPNPLRLTAPNGGESLFVGSTATLSWTTDGGTLPVNLYVSTNGGLSWRLIAPFLPASGSFEWFVDASPSTEALIRVESADGLLEDVSDAAFELALGTISVSAPAAGASFAPGTLQNIEWQSANYSGPVDLAVSVNDGASFESIARAEANDGLFEWSVPDAASTRVTVRVEASRAGPSGSSGVFAIQGADTIWYVNSDGGGGDGSSWFSPFTGINSALAAASAGDEVWVADGLYVGPLVIPDGVAVYGGFEGRDTETERYQRN
ncbi:MAG: hypothetical protein AAF658_10105, partial [Myxococcota bacterium]